MNEFLQNILKFYALRKLNNCFYHENNCFTLYHFVIHSYSVPVRYPFIHIQLWYAILSFIFSSGTLSFHSYSAPVRYPFIHIQLRHAILSFIFSSGTLSFHSYSAPARYPFIHIQLWYAILSFIFSSGALSFLCRVTLPKKDETLLTT